MSRKSRSTREYKGAGTGAASSEDGLRQFLALLDDAARAALESRALQDEDKECLEWAVRSAEEAKQLGKPLGEIWACSDELIEFVRSSSSRESTSSTESSPNTESSPSREHAAEHALECLWRLLAAVSAVSRTATFSDTLERHMEFRQAELMRAGREERYPEQQ